MITLYSFGPYFGLPDASPFVLKVMTLLHIAGIPFAENRRGLSGAPKGKLPYIDDDGAIVADSTFIRFHIERKYGFDFDVGLSPEQRAQAWAVEKMLEEHFYWILVRARWSDDANFERGTAQFFSSVPAPIRPLVKALVRRKIATTLRAQGIGRHTDAEVAKLGARDVETLAVLLGDKPFFFGDRPSGVDATAFAFIAEILTPELETPARSSALAEANLVAYRDRLLEAYFPNFAK